MAKTHHSDLTGFSSLLGDSFQSKIDLLTQIIQGAHYPSLGRYKERLLAKMIAEYVPKNLEVGTGFVLFVHGATQERERMPGFDAMNMGSHSISKQCDIIVFDSSKIPVIFRDDDFVVVRPESVRAVIEVKGTANKKEIDGLLDSFLDFGKKWRDCQLFYHEHHQPLARRPSLYAMCWSVGLDTRGRPLTNGTKIRKQIASFYNANAGLASMKGFPRLEKLFVYNECGVSESGWTEANSEKIEMGFATERGRFVRYDPAGVPYLGGDRTIASLLAGLHYAVGDDFNRFYSYVDEARQSQTPRYEHQGFSAWLPETASMRDANANLIFAAK